MFGFKKSQKVTPTGTTLAGLHLQAESELWAADVEEANGEFCDDCFAPHNYVCARHKSARH